MKLLTQNPVRPPVLVDMLVERMAAAILQGELSPGDRVREQALARSLGVGRGPLREAMRRLEGRGLIVRTPNLGASVTSLTREELEELLVIREALEGMACRLAATRITDEEIARLRDILAYQHALEAAGSMLTYYSDPPHLDFHFAVVSACRSPRLIELLQGDLFYMLRVYRCRSGTQRVRAPQSLAEHGVCLDALARRDGDAAEAAMRAHLSNARASILAAFDRILPAEFGDAPSSRSAAVRGAAGKSQDSREEVGRNEP